MPEPILKSNNIFGDFDIPYANESNSYTQVESTSGNLLNCRFPQVGPMEIALNNYFTAAAPPGITAYIAKALGNCVVPNISATNPDTKELYSDMVKEFSIFQTLFINNAPTGTTTSSLVPQYNISGFRISCQSPTETGNVTLIPHVLEYTLVEDYSRFIRFCASQTYINTIDFSEIDYKLFNYLDNSTAVSAGTICSNNSCTTATVPFLGFGNLNPVPISTRTKIEDKNTTTTYILMAVAGVLGIILIAIIIVYAMKVRSKDRLNSKIKTTKDTTYNPMFSKS
jgi:hypothetical protein